MDCELSGFTEANENDFTIDSEHSHTRTGISLCWAISRLKAMLVSWNIKEETMILIPIGSWNIERNFMNDFPL